MPPHVSRHQRKLSGQKPPAETQRDLGYTYPAPDPVKPRNLAVFNLAIDSKQHSCDLVALRVSDIVTGDSVKDRAVIVQ